MKRTILCGIAAAALTISAPAAMAADINFTSPISQGNFLSLSKDAGAAIGYRNMAPAEPLGITGFDISAEVSAMSIDSNSVYWKAAFNNDAPSYIILPKLRARKGLPFGVDIGAMYSAVPDSNVKLYGAEISKAILDGTMATPAIGIRGTYTKLAGVDDLTISTYGADASISKGFLFITPYVGAGIMSIKSEAKGYLKTLGLNDETTTMPRYFGGVKLSPLPLLSITAEAEFSENPIYSLKTAISF